jgi:hypothetical protein
VALEVAGELGLRRRVVLPFDAAKFRDTSVTDRLGDWGPLYDRIIEAVRRTGDLLTLEDAGEGSAAYEAANGRIIEETLTLAGVAPGTEAVEPATAFALIVWEGRARGEDDATEQFATAARQRGLIVSGLLTS